MSYWPLGFKSFQEEKLQAWEFGEEILEFNQLLYLQKYFFFVSLNLAKIFICLLDYVTILISENINSQSLGDQNNPKPQNLIQTFHSERQISNFAPGNKIYKTIYYSSTAAFFK
jgi:hypothetical protein